MESVTALEQNHCSTDVKSEGTLESGRRDARPTLSIPAVRLRSQDAPAAPDPALNGLTLEATCDYLKEYCLTARATARIRCASRRHVAKMRTGNATDE
jgi:hypothetical protein